MKRIAALYEPWIKPELREPSKTAERQTSLSLQIAVAIHLFMIYSFTKSRARKARVLSGYWLRDLSEVYVQFPVRVDREFQLSFHMHAGIFVTVPEKNSTH